MSLEVVLEAFLGVEKSNFERVVLRPWKQLEQVYFDKLDLVGLEFYLKLIQFENSPFQPQILIKIHDFDLIQSFKQ